MSLFIYDDSFVGIDNVFYKKNKVSQISESTDGDTIRVIFDNNLGIDLKFSDHGEDNNLPTLSDFLTFVKESFTEANSVSTGGTNYSLIDDATSRGFLGNEDELWDLILNGSTETSYDNAISRGYGGSSEEWDESLDYIIENNQTTQID